MGFCPRAPGAVLTAGPFPVLVTSGISSCPLPSAPCHPKAESTPRGRIGALMGRRAELVNTPGRVCLNWPGEDRPVTQEAVGVEVNSPPGTSSVEWAPKSWLMLRPTGGRGGCRDLGSSRPLRGSAGRCPPCQNPGVGVRLHSQHVPLGGKSLKREHQANLHFPGGPLWKYLQFRKRKEIKASKSGTPFIIRCKTRGSSGSAPSPVTGRATGVLGCTCQ